MLGNMNRRMKVVLGSLLFAALLITPLLTNQVNAQTRIAVAVNNGVVTTNQIAQRARFLRITGFKGDTRAEAQRQLINEELQFQEGKRVNFSIPDKAVDEAFANVARSNGGSSPRQFSKALRGVGVNPATFKQFIKARMLWQQIVVARARQEGRNQQTDADITSILFNRNNGGKNRKVKEYTVDQIIFVVKKGSSKSVFAQRRRELDAFRNQNKTCKQASDAAIRLAANGVIMRKLGRFTTDTLPPNIKSQVINANGQLFSTPEQGESGVGVLAICNVREIVDNSAPKDGLNVDVGNFGSEELQKKSDKWLKELRDRAKIVIR